MKKTLILCTVLMFILSSCGTVKPLIIEPNKEISAHDKVVFNALQFEGVKYRRGGVTTEGLDCSGVIYVAFGAENIKMPRQSRYMANEGVEITLDKAKKGDLLFFKTGRKSKHINHVGLIVSTEDDQINFIHATNSRGVIVSNLAEKYWKNSFVKVTTIF